MFALRNHPSLATLTLLIFLVLSALPLRPAVAAAPPQEFRGVWVTRFEWPSRTGDSAAMKSKIAEIMTTLAQNNFNAVIFQVRGQADTLYPCPYEPWSELIGGGDPGFDPLAYAIQEAHKNGLEFHAYINAFTCWDKKEPPANPKHTFTTHPDWLCRDAKGQLQYAEYQYFSPGVPSVQAHVRAVIMDVVSRYDVDGVHLDRIRYPARDVSHDPISEARFKGAGNPGKLKWEEWQRAQITGFLNDLYGQILAVKPQVKLTSAVWGIHDNTKIPGYGTFSSGTHQYYQDSLAWVRAGAMDGLVPMIYWNIGGKKPDYDDLYKYFMANAADRHVYGGYQTKYDDKNEPMKEIEFTRSVGGHGTVGFSYSGIGSAESWPLYRAVYAEKARVPNMPWKSDPTTGNILGLVRDPAGNAVVDAWVRVNGVLAVWLSSADGLFSILQIPPGMDYTLTVESILGQAEIKGVKVVTATTTLVEVTLQPPVAPGAETAPVAAAGAETAPVAAAGAETAPVAAETVDPGSAAPAIAPGGAGLPPREP